jgi:hypothetical protein
MTAYSATVFQIDFSNRSGTKTFDVTPRMDNFAAKIEDKRPKAL